MFSRRECIATGTTLIAGTDVPAWAHSFQPGAAHDAVRSEIADALGASFADLRINPSRLKLGPLQRLAPCRVPALKLRSATFTSISDAI